MIACLMLTGLNLIDIADRESIWIPALIFSNSEQNTPVSVDELVRSRRQSFHNFYFDFFILYVSLTLKFQAKEKMSQLCNKKAFVEKYRYTCELISNKMFFF